MDSFKPYITIVLLILAIISSSPIFVFNLWDVLPIVINTFMLGYVVCNTFPSIVPSITTMLSKLWSWITFKDLRQPQLSLQSAVYGPEYITTTAPTNVTSPTKTTPSNTQVTESVTLQPVNNVTLTPAIPANNVVQPIALTSLFTIPTNQ